MTRNNALTNLLTAMADDALIQGHRNSEWTGLGPMMEEDIAFSSMAQDKISHAWALYRILHEDLGGGQAVEPTEENILNQSYPIWRYLYIYVNPALDKGDVKKYLTWIRSDEGQALVKDVGYFPLPPKLRSGQVASN